MYKKVELYEFRAQALILDDIIYKKKVYCVQFYARYIILFVSLWT